MPYQMPTHRMQRRAHRVRFVEPQFRTPLYGWMGVSNSFGRVWAFGRRKPTSDCHWRIQFKGYLRANAYVGWDFDRQRFMVGNGTPCPRGGRFRQRIGWRKVAFS